MVLTILNLDQANLLLDDDDDDDFDNDNDNGDDFIDDDGGDDSFVGVVQNLVDHRRSSDGRQVRPLSARTVVLELFKV